MRHINGNVGGDKSRARTASNIRRSSFKGQVYMVEIITVLIVSMVVLVAALSMLGGINSYRSATDKTANSAEDAVNALILTRGFPPDWDQNVLQTSVLGIALRRNVIDTEKLNSLNLTNFSALMGLENSNVSITIESGGTEVYSAGFVNTSTSIILIERTCVFSNGTLCMLRVQISGGGLS